MFTQITDSDKIVLNSVESFMKAQGGIPAGTAPDMKLYLENKCRNVLYSDIARRTPAIAAYILSDNKSNEDEANGLMLAMSRHAMDPVFIEILGNYLRSVGDPEASAMSGALMAKILNNWLEKNMTETTSKKKDKKDAVEAKPAINIGAVSHLQVFVESVLGDIASVIQTRSGNVTTQEALAIAACLAMNNSDTIKEIIASDLPVTASIFDILTDPTNILKAALLIDIDDIPTTSANQKTFIDSLKMWTYTKLNSIPTQTCYNFLTSVYRSIKPDVSKYLIQIKDCGTQYSNLLTVAKQIVNK